MAARQEAFERRVRPIYDALDARNSKNALKLANAALEKFPNSSLVKALKSVALLRTGRQDEAHKICDELVGEAPQDEQALHVLLITLKDLHRPHDITALYEAAHARDAGNVDVLVGLFNSHVRQGSLAKQQQAATKLNKLAPSSQHAWWIVLSVMQQARAAVRGDGATPALEPAKLMQLAESMVVRQVGKDGRLDGFEALLVYLDLLLAQGKGKEALEVVTGPLGSVATMAAERVHLHAVLLMAAGDGDAAAELLRARLRANPDDWASLQLYCDCVMRPLATTADTLGASVNGNSGGGVPVGLDVDIQPWPESSLLRISGGLAELFPAAGLAPRQRQTGEEQRAGYDAARAMVKELVGATVTVAAGSAHKLVMRGPYLASVEVAHRAVELGLVPQSEVAACALEYVRRQGHLVSCAADLRPYTSKLGAEAAEWLAEQLKPLMQQSEGASSSSGGGASGTAAHATVRGVRTAVCCRQVIDDLGLPRLASASEAVAHAGELMAAYAKAQELYTGLDERERGPADELPGLAAASLVTAAACSTSDQGAVAHLLQAVLLLESCVRTRPYSAPMRLALAALYSLLGCPDAVLSQSKRLEIKNIQLDSLAGHHVLPVLVSYAPSSHEPLHVLLRDTLQLYNDHRKEAGETLAKAYQSGTYSKVLEFVAFRERLDAAHTRAVARAEKQLLNVWDAAQQGLEPAAAAVSAACAALPLSELPQLACSGAARLRFNEDLSTRAAWYPPSAASAHLAPTDWWQGRGDRCGQGYGRAWWACTASAEGAPAEAAAFRSGRHAAVRARWLVPHLLSGILQAAAGQQQQQTDVGPVGAASPSAAGSLTALLGDLQSCCSGSSASGGEASQARLRQRAEALEGGTAATTSDLDVVQLGVLAFGVRAAAVMRSGTGLQTAATAGQQGTSAEDGCVADDATLLARLLGGLSSALSRQIAGAVQDGGHGVLPGVLLNLASVLLCQHVTWLGLTIQAWSKFTKQAAYKKSRAEPEVERLQSDMAALRRAAADACSQLAGCLELPTVDATAAMSSVCAAAGDPAAAAQLWGWRQDFDAGSKLRAVWKEQAKHADAIPAQRSHCGGVKFQCSICSMKRNTHMMVPEADFTILLGADLLNCYQFETKVAQHLFCRVCGVCPFYRPRSNPDAYAVTIYCITPGTLRHVTVKNYDGIHWEEAYKATSIGALTKRL